MGMGYHYYVFYGFILDPLDFAEEDRDEFFNNIVLENPALDYLLLCGDFSKNNLRIGIFAKESLLASAEAWEDEKTISNPLPETKPEWRSNLLALLKHYNLPTREPSWVFTWMFG